MFNIKSADLTSPGQKLIAGLMAGGALVILWFLLPPLITILTNIWIMIGLGVPLAFLIYNYEILWSLFKRLSWNMTKKIISSDKLWYLWQGYNYLVTENQKMNEDIKGVTKSRLGAERNLAAIANDLKETMGQEGFEKDPTKKRILQAKVKMLDQQFKALDPQVNAYKELEAQLTDYWKNRVADTEILKIELEGKEQLYKMAQDAAKASGNAARWMKQSKEMKEFNESIKQIDEALDGYTASIEDFKRNILPQMGSASTARTFDAQEGAKLIEEYRKTSGQRLQINTASFQEAEMVKA